jgi:nucleotide-binding universal stress UspA family protein
MPVPIRGRDADRVQDSGDVIVVGVDGSPGASAALDFALAEAARRGSAIEVVTAWLGSGHLDATPDSPDLIESRARVEHMQDEVVARSVESRAGGSDVPEIERVVVHDYAGRVLVARSERASMVVVGSGSPDSGSQQALGSVAEYCIRHALVPVVVVPAPARLERRVGSVTQTV